MVQLLDRRVAETYADWFRALADPTRVQLLARLAQADSPLSVRELTSELPIGQSTVSHHLATLVHVGFVHTRRQGASSLYWVNPRCVERFPTAADVVMGRRPHDPEKVGCSDATTEVTS